MSIRLEENEYLECGVCGQESGHQDGDEESEAEEGEIRGEAEDRHGSEAQRVGADKGLRPIRRLVDPRRPTQAEVDLHELHHVPYRNWCHHCVRGRGKDFDHRRAVEEERGLS